MHTHQLTVDGDVVRKRYVSWEAAEAEREWRGLELLAEHAPGLAPAPLGRDSEDGAPVVVMGRVPGEPLGTAPLTGAQVDALGAALRRLFAVPVPDDLPERSMGPSVARGKVREWAVEPSDLAPCQDATLVGRALDRARAWLAEGDPATDRVVDPVAALGDGNLWNVIWDGTTCRLVDFEEFGRSDLTYEVADVVEHASSRLDRHLDADALLARLPLTGPQHERLRAHRRLLASFWLVMLLPGNRGFDRNPAGSTEDQARHLLGLLDDA
ncbi:phosphotransferase family protein [Nocardioides taihuensis]|uniref:Phosphotransferase family protein n=1 Tax=Nocardioides taihuensis TaxID=1835606 RepID=A0ABW0BQX4_9ACTN